MKTGISYSFYGMKQSDGMNRCLMLRGYENEAISNTNKVYPLSKWKKSDVMAYIKAKKLPEPISYNKNKSQGLTFCRRYSITSAGIIRKTSKRFTKYSLIPKYITAI